MSLNNQKPVLNHFKTFRINVIEQKFSQILLKIIMYNVQEPTNKKNTNLDNNNNNKNLIDFSNKNFSKKNI